MPRLPFAPVAAGYVAVVALLTVAGRLAPRHADLAAFVALAATLPTGLLYPLLALIPDHHGWYALPLLAAGNAFVLRSLRRAVPRDPVARGVEDRLHLALVSTRLAVTPMMRPGRRRERSLLLRDVPIEFPRLVGVYRDLWHDAGLRVRQQQEPLALRAYDREGYEFSLEAGPGVFGDAILRVAAPPGRRWAFVAGLATGAVPCVTAALSATYPALLLTGCGALVGGLACLVVPRTRAFGRGLLTGGVPALAVLLVYAAA
ncbi:hypothetical protein GCM10020358_53910 [Amorphoplanes nipponensis]|uniref:Uncharacterized protein n=1 Tax=Actinoplanes nipponensis TaxID=135950 RepID=A0A919JIK8_9ACTN|nr:hypothetical protein [Actinoplanes nipponensis]GIE51206.1 hypothetical protein Ani05nite_47400 [Actinoplanes nipponensis]